MDGAIGNISNDLKRGVDGANQRVYMKKQLVEEMS